MTNKKKPDRVPPVEQEVDQTIVFSNNKTEPSIEALPELSSSTDETSLPKKKLTLDDVGQQTLVSLGSPAPEDSSALSQTLDSSSSFLGLSAIGPTLDSASILASSNISQTIDPRDFDEPSDRDWQLSIGLAPQEPERRHRPQDRRKITESYLTVPARHISGMDGDIEVDAGEVPSDYEIVKILGEGGMGTVFLARQAALDRMVALKVVKRLDAMEVERLTASAKLEQVTKSRRDQFLAEAVVTGDLDHPNIVPIHDLAVTGDGTLFYVMKKVDGIPWSKVIGKKSQDENLEILLKVCDAIAFAHSRGIVHRDIKPENVMLGEFGVVLLMDWGLAVPKESYAKRGTIYQTNSLGGSPSYMAPEMIIGPIDAIGPTSDIYLLGATLFEIIVGVPPHAGKNVSECIRSVANNAIIEAPVAKRGELLDIAQKAMATNTSERYLSVAEFQDAIRQYRSHAESIMLTVRAEEDLESAKKTSEYDDHARSVFGFEEAFKLWDGNTRAQQGLELARLAYAETAYKKEDFDLGLSLLDKRKQEHAPLIAKLQLEKQERESRLKRLAWMKRTAVGLVAFIFVGGGGALYQISKDRDRARVAEREANANLMLANESQRETERQRTIADAEATEAKKQRTIAERKTVEAEQSLTEAMLQRSIAEDQKMLAEQQRSLAEQKAAEADRERRNADYEAYVAQIGLVKARIEQNEFDDARRILTELKQRFGENGTPSWEWRWLWQQANQSRELESLDNAVSNLSLSQQKTKAVVTLDDGTVQLFKLDGQSDLIKETVVDFPSIANATVSAIAPDESLMAVADRLGQIHLWDIGSHTEVGKLQGHAAEITSLVFVNAGRLLSGSRDRSIRLWDLATGAELASCWHIGPVVDVACNPNVEPMLVVAAVADNRSGRVVAWDYAEQGKQREFLRRSDLLEHRAPVLAVAISPSGKIIASGDRSGQILVWNPDDVRALNYGQAVSTAVKKLKSGDESDDIKEASSTFTKLLDRSEVRPLRLVSTNFEEPSYAHRDAIAVLRFNKQGTELLSASDDYTLKIWDVESATLKQTLRGHGAWVRGADFSGNVDENVVSASSDRTIRSWHLANIQAPTSFQTNDKGPDQQFAHRDEICSARFDRTGKRVVTASRDHTAAVLEIAPDSMRFVPIASLDEEKPQSLEEGSSFLALAMATDETNGRLFVGSADSVVRVWNLQAGTETSNISGTGLNTALAVSSDGTLLVTGSSSVDAQAKVWDVTPNQTNTNKLLHKLNGHQGAVTAVCISKDSRFVFTGDRNGMGILWNAQTGEPVGEKFLQHLGTRINMAAFHPNGTDLMLAGDNRQVTWIRLSDRSILKTFGHDGFVTKLTISKDGSAFATVSENTVGKEINSSLTVWDFMSDEGVVIQRAQKTGKGESNNSKGQSKTATLEGKILSVNFDSSGGITACHSDDSAGRITFWKPVSKADYRVKISLKVPAVLPESAEAISVSPNNLLTLNGDAVLLWDLGSMSHIRSFRAHGGISEADFSSDGVYVVTASRSIRIWNVATSKSVHKLEYPHAGQVNSIAFSPRPEDYRFVSAGDDGFVKLWEWDPKTQQSKQLRTFSVDESKRASINQVRFSSDGKRLLAVDGNGTALLWKVEGDEPPQVFHDRNAKTAYLCGAFSPDGRWIAIGCQDRQARIWPVQVPADDSLAPTVVLRGHADQIEDIRFLGSDSGSLRVFTGSRDKSARIWDPRLESGIGQGREILALQRHTLGVTAVDVTEDGSLLMTAGRDGSVILWPASIDSRP